MGRCAVTDCKTKCGFKFPFKDKALLQKWIDFVLEGKTFRTPKEQALKWWPLRHDFLCHKHFHHDHILIKPGECD